MECPYSRNIWAYGDDYIKCTLIDTLVTEEICEECSYNREEE